MVTIVHQQTINRETPQQVVLTLPRLKLEGSGLRLVALRTLRRLKGLLLGLPIMMALRLAVLMPAAPRPFLTGPGAVRMPHQ